MVPVPLKLRSVALSAENDGKDGSPQADLHRTQLMPGKARPLAGADGTNLDLFSVLIPDTLATIHGGVQFTHETAVGSCFYLKLIFGERDTCFQVANQPTRWPDTCGGEGRARVGDHRITE